LLVPFPPPIEPRLNLLPLDSDAWDWKAFERFCLDVVNALPDVRYAEFHGAQGDKQDGIDILAHLTNGGRRTYQCKKYKSFGPKRAETAIDENIYDAADEHVLLVSCNTSLKTQTFVRGHPAWRLIDRESMSSLVRTQLDREAARRIVEDHFGAPTRRAFLGNGPMTFVEPERYFQPFERGGLFRHDWTLAGRVDVLDVLSAELAAKRVVVLPGRGGIGKTRLLRELSRLSGDARLLFAVDDIAISDEAAEDLPLAPITVVVDDVHRRDDLAPLFAETVRREQPVTLLLATRPQRLAELRGALARAGYGPGEIYIAEPLGDLPVSDTEDLARQALGPQHQEYASALAAATADCPLVTVVGGQLLATRAVPPRLLERQQDFRDEVLTRWEDEVVGCLGSEFDATTVAGALRLVAALAPLSVADQGTVALAAEELGIDPPAVVRLLGELEDAGLVLARGRLRRIVPDVLADHILHRACLDAKGRPTGYADHLVDRYAGTSLTSLLRNLAELDWRIGMTAGASALLNEVWQNLREAFARADAVGRVEVLKRIRPAALFAAHRVLGIIELALLDPARPVENAFGGAVRDDDVRAALPDLLARVGRHPELAADAMSLLWELGRDDSRPLHSNPDHPIRLAKELGDYSVSSVHDDALLTIVAQLIAEGQADAHFWSPLELLRGLVSRTVQRTRMVGFAMQLTSDYVIASATAELRARVFALLADQARRGSPRTQYLAADLLGETLQPPRPPGSEAPRDQVDQWHDEELRLMEIARDLIASGSPLVRMELRRRVSWYTDLNIWPDVASAADKAVAVPVDPAERMLTVLAHPLELAADWDGAQAEVAAYGAALADHPASDDELAGTLDEAVEQLDATGGLTANAWPVLREMAVTNAARGVTVAAWLIEHPDRPLARFAGALLGPLRPAAPEQLRELLDRLDGDDVRHRRQLADYFQSGNWHADPWPSDLERMRRLLRDEDLLVRGAAIHALLPFSQINPTLATELALEADTRDTRHADLIDHVLSDRARTLSESQLEARLSSLEREKRLGWSSWQLLLEVGKTRPQRVLDLLLARARSDELDMRPIYDTHEPGDVLSGFDDDQYRDALRAVRQEALATTGLPRRHVGEVFWALDRDEGMSLDVLGEWLIESDLARTRAAARLFDPLPFARFSPDQDFDRGWQLLLEKADLLSEWIEAAARNGTEHAAAVREALMMALTGGLSGRGMGEAAERHMTTRDHAHELAARSRAGSLSRQFWTDLADRAEREIAEDSLEDEEFGEEVN
jgi:hypothetical protein